MQSFKSLFHFFNYNKSKKHHVIKHDVIKDDLDKQDVIKQDVIKQKKKRRGQ